LIKNKLMNITPNGSQQILNKLITDVRHIRNAWNEKNNLFRVATDKNRGIEVLLTDVTHIKNAWHKKITPIGVECE